MAARDEFLEVELGKFGGEQGSTYTGRVKVACRGCKVGRVTILAQYKRKHTSVKPITCDAASNGYTAGSGCASLQLNIS